MGYLLCYELKHKATHFVHAAFSPAGRELLRSERASQAFAWLFQRAENGNLCLLSGICCPRALSFPM